MRNTTAEINLSHLKYNFLNIRKKVKKSKVMAVVKADAYGHGMLKCVSALNSLKSGKPDYYGVALLEEAVELRRNGVKQPILTFSPFYKSELGYYRKYRIDPTVCSQIHIKELKKYSGRTLRLQINVDTGMGRLGIKYNLALKEIISLAQNKSILISGIYTHFATSDEANKEFAKTQLYRFNKIISALKDSGINYGLAHCANSGAILDLPSSYLDMVRPGISLYGYYPSQQTSESIKLKPVMSIVSEVSSVKVMSKGDTVSYGRLFTANSRINVGSLPIGYADGIMRKLTNNMKAIIRNKFYEQVGRVTMDRISFNLKKDNIKEGDRAILIGKSGKLEITAWDWCKIIDTIPYEITCNISRRVPRVFIK